MNYTKIDNFVDLSRFLGNPNYYRRLIPIAAEHQAALKELLRQSRKNDKLKVVWAPAAESAFEKCNQTFTSSSASSFVCEGLTRAHNRPIHPLPPFEQYWNWNVSVIRNHVILLREA
jgi:hypothetical protein